MRGIPRYLVLVPYCVKRRPIARTECLAWLHRLNTFTIRLKPAAQDVVSNWIAKRSQVEWPGQHLVRWALVWSTLPPAARAGFDSRHLYNSSALAIECLCDGADGTQVAPSQ